MMILIWDIPLQSASRERSRDGAEGVNILKYPFLGYFGLLTAENAKKLKIVSDYISEAYLQLKKNRLLKFEDMT